MSTPAPSPITNPSRRASNGREIPVGDSACIELKLPNPNGVSVASAPPTTTASASSYWIIRSAQPIACAPLEHAETTLYIWPLSPNFIDTAAAAAFGICAGIPSGDIRAGPRSRSTSCWSSIVWIPPIPVARMQPSAHRVVRQAAVPAGVGDRLAGGDDPELREPVEPADLLDRQQLARLEVRARAGAVEDPALAGGPARVQGLGADAQRRDGAQPRDHDFTSHGPAI